jgi:small conductance mechanosensitive channel
MAVSDQPAAAPSALHSLDATVKTAMTDPLSNALVDHLGTTLTGQKVAVAKLTDAAGDFITNAAISLLILLVTLWLATWASRLAKAAFSRVPSAHRDDTLAGFISSLVRYVIVLMGGIAILNRLGFQTTSIITVLGAASLAVGLALQGALTNVAAGVMVLMLRPYRVGDYVTIAGKTGTVKRLDLFNTELADPDGLKIVTPNGKAFGDVMVNYTDIPRRRINIKVGIDYDDSIEQAINIVLDLARSDKRLLADPAPWCMATELAESAVIIELRAWAEGPVFWNVYFDLLRGIKEGFDAAGITIPYPTQIGVTKPQKPKPAGRPKGFDGKPVETQTPSSDPRAPEGVAPPAKPPGV